MHRAFSKTLSLRPNMTSKSKISTIRVLLSSSMIFLHRTIDNQCKSANSISLKSINQSRLEFSISISSTRILSYKTKKSRLPHHHPHLKKLVTSLISTISSVMVFLMVHVCMEVQSQLSAKQLSISFF